MMPPERSHEQRMQALEAGNVCRVANAALKRRLAAMPRGDALWEAAQIIRYPIDHEEAIRLDALLMSVQTVGATKAAEFSKRSVARSNARLRSLSQTQRAMIAARVEERARSWQCEQVYA